MRLNGEDDYDDYDEDDYDDYDEPVEKISKLTPKTKSEPVQDEEKIRKVSPKVTPMRQPHKTAGNGMEVCVIKPTTKMCIRDRNSQGHLRNDNCFRYGRGDRLPELYEYRGNHNDYAEYRNSASLCQQRYDVSAESVYRNGIRTERSITEKKFILV